MLLHSCKFTLCHLQELESFYRGVHAADAGPALPRRCSCRRRIPLRAAGRCGGGGCADGEREASAGSLLYSDGASCAAGTLFYCLRCVEVVDVQTVSGEPCHAPGSYQLPYCCSSPLLLLTT